MDCRATRVVDSALQNNRESSHVTQGLLNGVSMRSIRVGVKVKVLDGLRTSGNRQVSGMTRQI